MYNRILQLYPNAISSPKPYPDEPFVWIQDDNSKLYIGVPTTDLSNKEIALLHTLFPIHNNSETFSISVAAREWQDFLENNGQVPQSPAGNCRFIHYSISDIRDEFHLDEWEEAVKSLFSNDVIIVPFSRQHGIVIEEQSNLAITEDELFSAIQAFESDFFFKTHFYIGRFEERGHVLQLLYTLEKTMFKNAVFYHPEERIFTREKLLPFYLNQTMPGNDKIILFADVHQLLIDDQELANTIIKYIENQSNATLTAKQLFMHRNSLQYRIDKFIEKTGIDIKTFHGAFFAYMACLHIQDD